MTDIILPDVFDRTAARSLAAELATAISAGNVTLDAAAVTQIGQTGLQLLLSAARSASEKGVTLKIVNPSESIVDAAMLTGIADHLLAA
jgi:anti-anti-sigma regulatory factor